MKFILLLMVLGILVSGCTSGTPPQVPPIGPVTPPPAQRLLPVPCEELIQGHNNLNDPRVNVVFVGIDYQNIDEFAYLADLSLDYNDDLYGLLSLEPFKSNRDKFNFWYVDKLDYSVNGTCVYGTPECGDIAFDLARECKVNNKQIVGLVENTTGSFGSSGVVFGWAGAGGSDYSISRLSVSSVRDKYNDANIVFDINNPYIVDCSVYDSNGDSCIDAADSAAFFTNIHPGKLELLEINSCSKVKAGCQGNPMDIDLNDASFDIHIINHEFGHSFGNLDDEYVSYQTPYNLVKTSNTRTIFGMFSFTNSVLNLPKLNSCFFGTPQDCVNPNVNTMWGDLLGDDCKDPGLVDCTPSDDFYNLEVNCYQGCYYYGSTTDPNINPYRSAFSTLMRNYLTSPLSYGKSNERVICEEIKRVTGSVGGFCTTEFGII